MYKAFLFCILGCSLSLAKRDSVFDDETEATFKQLEAVLYDKQQSKEAQEQVKELLKEIKDEVTKKPENPEYGKKILAVTKSLSGAVPKLKSSDGFTVAEGALLIIAGIAEQFPPPAGIILAPLATLVSSIFGYLTPDKVFTIPI